MQSDACGQKGALNNLAELQLEHPVANDPMAQGGEQPDLPREDAIIQDVPFQLAASHVLNNLGELQLEHPVANDPMAQGGEQPDIPREDAIIQDIPIQLPAPHRLGDMNNICPHCGARFFHEECTTQRIFTKCCFQGKVTLPPIQIPPANIALLFTGNTADSRHFLENICHYNAAMAMASWNIH